MFRPHRRRSHLAVLAVLSLACPTIACGPDDAAVDTLPGRELVFPLSVVHLQHEQYPPGEALVVAMDASRDIRSGVPIAEVARRASGDDEGGQAGGWLGFMEPREETLLDGVMQALAPGTASGPVATKKGFDVFYRHTIEEGREIEEKRSIPVYGFLIGWAVQEGQPLPSKDVAKRMAEDAWEAIHSGTISMGEAKTRFNNSQDDRQHPFLMLAQVGTRTEDLYRRVENLAVGELAPLNELSNAYGIFRRGEYLRSIVRHVMIFHTEGPTDVAKILGGPRSRDEARQRAEDAMAMVKLDGSNWMEVVEEYSDEELRTPIGGFLGCIGNGDLMPILEDAVLETPPGRVLDRIVETPSGFHLIYRET